MKARRGTKALLALGLCFALLPASGCSQTPDPLTLMEAAGEEMQKLESYAAQMTMEFNMGIGDGESTINMGMNGEASIEVINDPKTVHSKAEITVSTLGQTETSVTESYQFEQDGKTVEYFNEGDGWTTNAENDLDAGTAQDAMEMFDYDVVKDLEPAVTGSEKIGDVDTWRIEFQAGIEDLMALADTEIDSSSEALINTFGEDITLECALNIDKETNRYVRAEITLGGLEDLFRLAMSTSELPEGMEVTMDDIQFIFTYNSFNDIDEIKIPQEVLGVQSGKEQTHVWESMKLTIGDHTVTIGECTVQDLIDAGLTIDTADQTLEAGDYNFISAARGDDMFSLALENTTADTISLEKATVYSFYGPYIKSQDIVLEGGIRAGSSTAEVLEAYGDPNEISDEDYYDDWHYEVNDGINSKELILSIEDGVVTDIDLTAYYFSDLSDIFA